MTMKTIAIIAIAAALASCISTTTTTTAPDGTVTRTETTAPDAASVAAAHALATDIARAKVIAEK